MSKLPDYFFLNHLIFPELRPFENLGVLNLSAIYLGNYLDRGLKLGQL